ncbi:MAG: hypothetical protein ACKOYM_07530 [Actinomycetes bacterium]
MLRKFSVPALIAAMALVAGACTLPPGPTPKSWTIRPASIKIIDGEDNDYNGDEPYVIQLGFRSKVGVNESSSTTVTSQCRTGTIPTAPGPDGTTVQIPAGGADTRFTGVQNLDIGDVLLQTAPLEILGTMSFVAERDAIFSSCALTDAFDQLLSSVLTDALDLLIAAQPVPPTQEQLVALLTDNIGHFLNAILSFLGTILEGLGNPDDIVGVVAQIFLPTSGAFAGLIDAGLAIGGIFKPGLETGILPIDSTGLRIRIGQMRSSSTTFSVEIPYAAKYDFTSTVIPG